MKFQTVKERPDTDNRLRRVIANWVFSVIALVIFLGAFSHAWTALQTGDTSGMDAYVDRMLEVLIPLVTLIVGYLCGKKLQGSEKGVEEK